MPLSIAPTTNLRLTSGTLPIPASLILMYVAWIDPLTTSSRRTIYTVLGRVFEELPVPRLLEVEVEEPVDVLERDVVGGAASRWHVCGVGNGELEDAL